MNRSIYIITGVLALTFTGVAMSQDADPRGRMAELDTDGNGTIEKSEFTAMFDKRYAETDTNGGGITFAEYEAKIASDRAEREARREERRAENSDERAERSAERTKKRFERLDADSDGTVSAEEYKTAGENMFDRMDRNDDGILNDRRGRGERGKGRGRGRGPRT